VKRILVVDDEIGIAEAVSDLLGDEGYVVDVARNGEDAITLLSAKRFDLVLLDWMMPITDGLGVMTALRGMANRKSPPVIVMSALPEDVVRSDAEIAGFLRKPFDVGDLLRVVSQTLPAR